MAGLAIATLLGLSPLLAGGGILLLALAFLVGRFRRRLRDLATELLLRFLPALGRGLAERRRQSYWLKTSAGEGAQRIWGYADRHSIAPGEAFRLALSAGPGAGPVSGTLEVYRIGHYADGDRALVWRGEALQVPGYQVRRAGRDSGLLDNTAAALGPNWRWSLAVEATADWQSGYHSVDFVGEDGARDRDIAYIVVTPAKADAPCDILVKLATATYQAYNKWGGHSLYDDDDNPVETRGHMVSFDRPTPSKFWTWEYYFVLWLERLAAEEGLTVAYATNHDIARSPELARDCRLLVSVGHDEYWSKEEFDAFHDRIFQEGGNTLFLGANTAYWQVRYADTTAGPGDSDRGRGRQLVCFKSLTDPRCGPDGLDPALHATGRFREDARRPESMLMGIAYQSNFRKPTVEEPRYPYTVASTDFPFFEGTGYEVGDFVADVIGHEWDNRNPEAEYGPPGEQPGAAEDRLWCSRRSRIDLLPFERIKPVLSGRVVDLFGREGLAEAVTFDTPAGAKVFSAGTIRWSWGLGKPGYVEEKFQRLNRNLILHFLEKGSDKTSGAPRERPQDSDRQRTPDPVS